MNKTKTKYVYGEIKQGPWHATFLTFITQFLVFWEAFE